MFFTVLPRRYGLLRSALTGTPRLDGEGKSGSGNAVIRFEQVAMRYGEAPDVLRDIDLDLAAGSFHFLTGPSGAGKSTLLRLMYLAERPSAGAIHYFDRDVAAVPRRELPELRRRIGVVFQEFRLLDHLTAFDNVALPLRVLGTDEAMVKSHVTDLLGWVGLADQVQARPSTLSGGQKQRIAIARAVIGQPHVLLADEPTGNVDDAMALRLLGLFDELNRLGTTVVIATHNEALIERFGHPTLMLADGRVHLRPGTRPG